MERITLNSANWHMPYANDVIDEQFIYKHFSDRCALDDVVGGKPAPASMTSFQEERVDVSFAKSN